MAAGKENRTTDEKAKSRIFIIIFCIATAAYLVVCAAIFISTNSNEQNAYVSSKPVTYADDLLPEPEKKININTATHDELTEIVGIGDVTADRIIEYREKNGGFLSTDEIMKVSGIGKTLYNKIKELIEI